MTSELCQPDATGERCAVCGWFNRFGPPFPLRPCDNPSDLRPAALKLGIDLKEAPGMAATVAKYAAGQSLGPGDWLHIAILKWVKQSPTSGCGCENRIAQMNQWGVEGCREHLDEIVDWLAEEAKNRGWWKYAVAVPGSRYFIKQMVLKAIKKAETNQPKE